MMMMMMFCSLVVLDPRVGHTMDVLSPFVPVLMSEHDDGSGGGGGGGDDDDDDDDAPNDPGSASPCRVIGGGACS